MGATRIRRTPIWAVLCTVLGSLLMVGSGTVLIGAELVRWRVSDAVEEGNLFEGDGEEQQAQDIEGPLNFLLAGLDTRPSRPNETPRSDAIVVAHVPESMDRAYMISMPRDLLVDIPPFQRGDLNYYGATNEKINEAMAAGAGPLPGEEEPDLERGFALLAETVGQLTGIERFDAGAVIQFWGFVGIVDALGGITIHLDEEVVSRHREPDGTHRELAPHGENFIGPQATYPPGKNELEGWEALDVARQRYGIEDSDYGRQGHQQQILQAMLDKAFSRDVVTDPGKMNDLLNAAGDALVFDGRGNEPFDFALALRNIRPGNLSNIVLPGGAVHDAAGDYAGEQLKPEGQQLLEALGQGRLDEFIVDHPDMIE